MSPQDILEGKVRYDEIDEKTFLRLGSGYITRYSNDELYNMFHYMKTEFVWQKRRLEDQVPVENKETLNVFDAILAFDNAVLTEEEHVPLCQYKQLLKWRDMTTALEEDLFVTSYLAFKDHLDEYERKYFFWRPVIGHNNHALNSLVAKGVAENHFHLKGSAPTFHLTWLSLMNCVDSYTFNHFFEEYENERMQKNISLSGNSEVGQLSHMWRQAVLIRLLFFSILQDDPIQWDGISDVTSRVRMLLADKELLKSECGDIQRKINDYKERYGRRQYDYFICSENLVDSGKYDLNGILSGERWFMYRMFYAIYQNDPELEQYFDLFYLYIVLKSNIRRELVQTNQNVGFDNFRIYQDRKDVFISGTCYEPVYIRMAVRDTILNQHIKCLEARITPKGNAAKLQQEIKKNDCWITYGMKKNKKKKLLDKYFYVIHFIKETERNNKENDGLYECRHSKKREQVMHQALAIARLRESGVKEATRIRGIDASASEIWCRPEVFAQAFRFLENHVVPENVEYKSKPLMATYHVGEDFLDIIDGLRAIDEAIRFLNLRCGDRLGHALALGVDVNEWYEGKSNRILINKMNYLDNLVWMYAQIRKYNLPGCESAKSYIEKRFREYFIEIYENNMNMEDVQDIVKCAKERYEDLNIPHNYHHNNLVFGINEYYEAWKLRGDNPELYKEGFFDLKDSGLDSWDCYAVNKEFPQNYRIRYNPATAILYYTYHYNKNVKLVGDEMIEVKVNPQIIDVVRKLQVVLQREICSRGISIETNPSSNYLIGTFRRYDKHPISRWYNLGLTLDTEQLRQCAQMQVSINTDDQGVFSTYIENEYAYLALALEKMRDEEGNLVYNRTMILEWLNHIRKMGIEQSFR